MARIAGITIEKDYKGRPRYARIDLRKYADDLKDFFKDKGIVIEDMKLTAKLKQSINEAKSGNYTEGNINKFWE